MIVLSVVSCKTTKTVSEINDKKDIKTEKLVVSDSTELFVKNTESAYNDQSSSTDDMDEQIIITIWSEPDSQGNQHQVQTTEINRAHRINIANNVKASVAISEKNNTNKKVQDNTIIKESSEKATTEKSSVKTNTPIWAIGLIAMVALVVIFLIVVVLKRFNIL